MFSRPWLEQGQTLPKLPTEDESFLELVEATGISPDPSKDLLPQLAEHAIHNWLWPDDLAQYPSSRLPHAEVPQTEAFENVGMVKAIVPHRDSSDTILLDGGDEQTYDYRLAFVDKLYSQGYSAPQMLIFAGQRLRDQSDDNSGRLEDIAQNIYPSVEEWGQTWLEQQLNKDPSQPDRWVQPFATEHEIAVLSLLNRYGGALEHKNTVLQKGRRRVDPSIPPISVTAEEFNLSGRDIRVMNSPAVKRRFLAFELPITRARPTTKSCLQEWVATSQPAEGESALLVTHNPNIYRSWLDGIIALSETGRDDISFEGAGDAIVQNRQYGVLLQSLGRLFVNYCFTEYGPQGPDSELIRYPARRSIAP